jgi:predicted  nucleic acid-binding Zn-ribbon protein
VARFFLSEIALANNPEVEALRKVDELDVKASRLKRDITDTPAELDKHKAQCKAAKDRVQACHEEQKKLQREIDKIDLETKSNLEQVKKFQIQQNTVKTNEEYSALKKQIEAVKKQNGEYEDKALGFYEKIDSLKAEEAGLKKAVAEAEGKLKAEEAEVKKDLAGLEEKLGAIVAERSAAEGKVAPTNLQMYRRILEKLGNRALAPVHGRTCQGCFIEIAPNTLAQLLGGKELVQCKACARILYLESDYRALSPTSYLVTEKDRDSTSKDGNW